MLESKTTPRSSTADIGVPWNDDQLAARPSGANIVFPPLAKTLPASVLTTVPSLPAPPSRTPEEVEAFFEEVRAMLRSGSYGKDKNVLLQIAIMECIDFGFDTRGRIFGACRRLGFKDGHPQSVLKLGTGENPEVHQWRRSADGSYFIHDKASMPS